MTTAVPLIYIALPALDELENLPVFIDCIRRQDYPRYRLFVCINQPESWWSRVDKLEHCMRNKKSLDYLHSIRDIDMTILDKSSKGKGWPEKQSGVGQARRLLMDSIERIADGGDIILSLDADTTFNPGYLSSIAAGFSAAHSARAISVPYYHKLTGDEVKDRLILRYEIYMRYYAINLWRINSPYSFTAIGSAIALHVKSYRAIGGITPHKSGEDFYFLQKLRKYGPVLTWTEEKVYPAARYSDRVGFGTGPAMIKGRAGDWSSYPVYAAGLFDEVKKTYENFRELYSGDVVVPMDGFIREKFGAESIWEPLRKNCKTQRQFQRACHHKLDAFRVLQFLKWKSNTHPRTDEENLFECLETHYPDLYGSLTFDPAGFTFEESPVTLLDDLRNLLAGIEENYQKAYLITPGFEHYAAE